MIYSFAMNEALEARARLHGALAEPHRLAIIDELAHSDRSPKELAERLGIATNLLAHHLETLESAGLVRRFVSSGDRRRRYVRLERQPLESLGLPTTAPAGTVLFVCTHNSARSQLAAAMWTHRTGRSATSSGTHPADHVHPGAVAAAKRIGLDLGDAAPRRLDSTDGTDLVVTVCDRAHEELSPLPDWLHWSIPDPAASGSRSAFDQVIADLGRRIDDLVS